jgi:hypothetical protein
VTSPASTLTIADELRGDRHARPPADTSSAAGLRAALEDGLYEILREAAPEATLVLRASSLAGHHASDAPFASLARLRGTLVSQLLRLRVVGAAIDEPFADALAAWRAQRPEDALVAGFDQLDEDERARLSTEVTAHFVTLDRALGEVRAAWLPRTGVRATQRLHGGRVILRDTVDLMVGAVSEVASVALLDVSTSPLGEQSDRILRYHALVQTLRTSVVPLRSTMFSSATGELRSLEVDHELLVLGAGEVLDAVRGLGAAR